MKRSVNIAFSAAVVCSVFGMVPAADATPSSTTSAQDTVNRLQSLGYNVSLNGSVTAPLSRCNVIGIHPDDPGTTAAKQFQTIWLDVSCPPTNN